MYNKPGTIDSLPPQCRTIFSELAESLEYSSGQSICQQGDEDGYLYLLKSGSLSVVNEDEHGEKRKLATITPGAFFGEINFIFGARRVASVIADEDVEVSRLNRSMTGEIIKRLPELYNRLHDIGLNRWGLARFFTNPLFRDISPEDQDAMLEHAFSGTYGPGSVLFDHQDRVDDFILLISGTMYIVDQQGVEKELSDGDWLVACASLDGGPSLWRAIPVIECMAVFVPLAAMREASSHNEAFRHKLEAGCSA
ncbi:MAG TPA: cyclic nucleotide-binding domain-containing protein [Mariprofundaceae bacterium]|nr:cyclic nucleotide-binding domain-containing protein [Mariprofundaceae bacterium]